MDSKLIQSNIAKQNRLQLVVEAVRVFLKTIDIESLQSHLSEEQYELLEKLRSGSTSNFCYTLDNKEKEATFLQFGKIVMRLIELNYISAENILYKIFHQQFDCSTADDGIDSNLNDGDKGQDGQQSKNQVSTKNPKQIGSGSIQSVHDKDAAYRRKGKDQTLRSVNGYHSNITETCDQKGKPNLITDVITGRANQSECDFLLKGIVNTN